MGLPLALRAVEVGYDVVGFDLDVNRVKRLADGDSYVEDISDGRLAAALATGRYLPTVDPEHMAGFDVAVIDVPTPLEEGVPNLAHVEEAAATLGRHLRPGATVVLESTTYPGTTEELVVPILEAGLGPRPPGATSTPGYSPERIDPGNPTWHAGEHPQGGVRASTPPRSRWSRRFYGRLVERTVAVSGTREAELTKLLENTFRHVNIALVNELAMFAADLGIDIWEAIDAASTKPFGYMRFTPGPGVGGHCLPIDPSYLSWKVRRSLGPAVPVRRAGQRRQRAHARLRRPPADAGPQPDGAVRQRVAGPAPRPGLQAQHRRRPRGPGTVIARSLVALGADVRVADPHLWRRHARPSPWSS